MISIKGQKSLKAGLALILLTLAIGNTAALSWNSPDEGTYDEDIQVSIDTSNFGNNVENVSLEVVTPNDDELFYSLDSPGSETYSGTFGIDDASGTFGEYEITPVINRNGANEESLEMRSFILDGSLPNVEKKDGQEYVPADAEVEFTVSDEYTAVTNFSVDSFNAEIEDPERDDVCSAGGECTVSFELDTSEISQGDTFTLDVIAQDLVGNEFSGSFSYTLDNEYQAHQPEFTVEDADENNNVDLNGDVNLDVTVGNIDEEESDVQVKCLVDGDEVSTTDWEDEEDFSCQIPSEEVDDDTVDVSVEACDRAGNCEESSEDSYTFDSMSPEVESFSTSREYNVYSDDFDVNYEAFDSASGVEELEYFFYAGTAPGDGNAVAFDGEGEFKVDTALLDGNGEQTVYLRARDAVGHWSDVKSIDFEYHPDATPTINLEASDDFSVEAGSSGDIDVVVENTGKLLVQSVTVTASSQILNGSKTVEDLTEGESVNAEFGISPTENQTGLCNVSFTTETPEASDSIEVLVEANSEQRANVDAQLETYSSRMAEIKSNVSELQSSGLQENLNDSLNSGVSSFVQQVESAQQFKENGEYHRALSAIEGIDASYESASSTVEEVKSQHEANQFRQTLIMIFLGLLIIGGAGGTFLYTSDRRDFEIEALQDLDVEVPALGGLAEKVQEKVEAFKEKLAEEEEEVEEKFKGFN